MACVVSQLLERGHFLLLVYSSLGDDQSVIPELLERLDEGSKKRLAQQMHSPSIATWKDLVALLLDVDFLVASRLHSTILGFMSHRPVVAISFDPKVDWIMEDLDQTDYLLQIRDFVAKDVLAALDRAKLNQNLIREQIGSYKDRTLSASAAQYNRLANLAIARRGHHGRRKNVRLVDGVSTGVGEGS
jgi:polysaccharide pyruvyl transferase WcaK-like protein